MSKPTRVALCAALALLLLPGVAMAQAARIDLVPGGTEVGFRAYGLGLLPMDGKFTSFHGWLAYSRPDHADCSVELKVDLASLVMDHESLRDDVLGPDIMDAAQFPVMSYAGKCQAVQVEGMLTVHGETHPFALAIDWGTTRASASGRLHRADWGMSGKPFLAGPNVRIDVAVPLPADKNAAAR